MELLAALLLRGLTRVPGRWHQAHIDCGPLLMLFLCILALPRHSPSRLTFLREVDDTDITSGETATPAIIARRIHALLRDYAHIRRLLHHGRRGVLRPRVTRI